MPYVSKLYRDETHKECSVCHAIKPRAAFFKASRLPTGISPACKECLARSTKERYDRDPTIKERAAVYAREYRKRHRERINAEKRAKRIERYGLTTDEFVALSESQDHRCAICGAEDSLCIDHCHTSGKVRGLLCNRCNKAIGFLDDSADLLHSAWRYLSEHSS